MLPLLAVLAVAATAPQEAPSAHADAPHPAGAADLPVITWHDNDVAAGTMRDGTLHLDLVVTRATWHPYGPDRAAVTVLSFGERDAAPSIPAPLVRVERGTHLFVGVTNTLDAAIEIEGLVSRGGALGLSWERIEAGDTREFRFVADVAGNYLYRARLPEPSPTVAGPYEGLLLSGALVVDEPGAEREDELMVIQEFIRTRNDDGTPDFSQAFLTINGRPWPHTKRLNYAMGDSIRWRVLNASTEPHPMHLHGFFFEVEARGDLARDTIYWPAQRRMAVTELMDPWTTMTVSWTPDRPGGWIFHCHLSYHVQTNPALDGTAPGADDQFMGWLRGADAHDGHDHTQAMGGLVTAIEIAAPPDWQLDRPGARMQRLHIHMDSIPGHMAPRFTAVLQAEGDPPEPAHVAIPGSLLLLPEGPPATVRVLNHTAEATQLHWHGLELESYYDGVPGGTGYEGRRTPPIAAGDSFDVALRTTRPGTYIYHTHMSDIRQQGTGLYGPLIIVPRDEPWDPARERIVLLGEGMGETADMSAGLFLNGGLGETPMTFEAGREHRLRLINISLGFPLVEVSLLRDGYPVRWVPHAEDAFAVPAHRQAPVPARRRISMGETFDFLYEPSTAGAMVLEVRSANGNLLISQPITVRPRHVQEAEQLASAVEAAPEDARADATVLGWDAEANVVTLREGTNAFVCLADDPRDDAWSVACYHRDLEPYMARGRELRAAGMSGTEAGAQRFAEVEAGTLALPEGKVLYVLHGDGWDAAEGAVVNPYLRWVIYRPYATPESTGLPERPRAPGEPWLMDAGAVGAHIMITPPRGGG